MKNPKLYGWLEVDDDGKAKRVSCKEPISDDPIRDHAVIGAFSFRYAELFTRSVDSMITKNRRINGEFYMDIAVDECIQLSKAVRPMEVVNYTCWGTPVDLEKYKISNAD